LAAARKDLKTFFGLLLDISKGGNLEANERRNIFLDELLGKNTLIADFFEGRFNIFKSIYNVQLAGLDDDEVENLYKGMEMSSFQLEKTSYETTLMVKIEDIKKHQARGKLIAIWRGKTNSDSPREWSQIHKTPALVMVKSDLYEEAKLVFGTLNEKSTPAYNVERALDILQKHEDILESFCNADSIDRAFQDKLLGRYAVVLKDIQSVRANLKETLGENVYDWYGHPDLQRVISKLAQGEYVRNCASRLAGEIDKMSADEAKKYLKKLVANQLEIGIEILSER
jgi:hypothetical protein